MCVKSLWLRPTLCDLMAVAHQALLSMGFSRQKYWSGLHVLLQGIFLTQGWNPGLLHLLHGQADSSPEHCHLEPKL